MISDKKGLKQLTHFAFHSSCSPSSKKNLNGQRWFTRLVEINVLLLETWFMNLYKNDPSYTHKLSFLVAEDHIYFPCYLSRTCHETLLRELKKKKSYLHDTKEDMHTYTQNSHVFIDLNYAIRNTVITRQPEK